MSIFNNVLLFSLFLSTLISVVMLYIVIFVRQAPKSMYFSFMILSVTLFNLGYLFELSGGGYEPALLAAKIEYLGVPFITPFLFLFVMEYCAKKPLTAKQIFMVMVIPMIAAVLVITWPWSDLYYKQLIYDPDAIVPRFIVTGGIAYYLYFIYTNVLVISTLIIVIYYRRKGDALFKKQTSTLVLGTTLPVIGFTINVLKIGKLPIDATPILLSITCILLGYAIFRRGLYALTPIAQEQIVENMNDGFILLDMQGVFIDANAAAKKLFPQLSALTLGSNMPVLEEITWSDDDCEIKKEFTLTDDKERKTHYQASQSLIVNNGKTIGRSVMIYDITEAKERLDEVRRMAEHDALTGLINRGTLYKNGKAVFAQFSAKSSAAVLMIDIDFFKHVNDNYGHLIGDEVLKKVAQALNSRIRATDLVGRYGGEEFCVFLPRIRAEDIIGLAEEFRISIEKLDLLLNGEKVNITISIGIAIYDASRHYSFEAFISDADTALYEAKNAGRNCVKCFTAN